MSDDIEDDTHDLLVLAFLDYFKSLEKFHKSPSVAKRIAVRKHLSKIRELAKERRQEIIDSHRHVGEMKHIKKKNIKKKAP